MVACTPGNFCRGCDYILLCTLHAPVMFRYAPTYLKHTHKPQSANPHPGTPLEVCESAAPVEAGRLREVRGKEGSAGSHACQ